VEQAFHDAASVIEIDRMHFHRFSSTPLENNVILAQWDAKWAGKFINSDLFIETIYDSLTSQKTAPFVQHN